VEQQRAQPAAISQRPAQPGGLTCVCNAPIPHPATPPPVSARCGARRCVVSVAPGELGRSSLDECFPLIGGAGVRLPVREKQKLANARTAPWRTSGSSPTRSSSQRRRNEQSSRERCRATCIRPGAVTLQPLPLWRSAVRSETRRLARSTHRGQRRVVLAHRCWLMGRPPVPRKTPGIRHHAMPGLLAVMTRGLP